MRSLMFYLKGKQWEMYQLYYYKFQLIKRIWGMVILT